MKGINHPPLHRLGPGARAWAWGLLGLGWLMAAPGYGQTYIDLSTAVIFGAVHPGGPDSLGGNILGEGSSLDLLVTPAGTLLYTHGTSWVDDADNNVSYQSTIKGGRDSVSGDTVVITGQIIRTHSAIATPSETIGFGTSSMAVDVHFNSPVTVTFTATATNALNDATAGYRTGLDIYEGHSWDNFLEISPSNQSAAPSSVLNFTSVLPSGDFRFDLWGNIWTEPTWAGGTLTVDFNLTFAPIPEPRTGGLIVLGLLTLALRRPHRA